MSKLGRHERTIRLPEEEPWRLPAPEPAPQRAEPVREPAPVPQKEREPAPARR
ncbi:MAG TPA: hypothetical protein VF155_02000 [Candidatus Dormibacteraeota bacterium]